MLASSYEWRLVVGKSFRFIFIFHPVFILCKNTDFPIIFIPNVVQYEYHCIQASSYKTKQNNNTISFKWRQKRTYINDVDDVMKKDEENYYDENTTRNDYYVFVNGKGKIWRGIQASCCQT